MKKTRVRPHPREMFLAGLTLWLSLFFWAGPRTTATPPTPPSLPAMPLYWVAEISVDTHAYDTGTFPSRYREFFVKCHDYAADRCKPAAFGSHDPCREGGRKMANCEYLSVKWNSQTHELYLQVNEHEGLHGYIYYHSCPMTWTFEDCFEHCKDAMAASFSYHDRTCHGEKKVKCTVNDDQYFVPYQ